VVKLHELTLGDNLTSLKYRFLEWLRGKMGFGVVGTSSLFSFLFRNN
jgi:hypothetical protein